LCGKGKLLSLKAMFIPRDEKMGADILSRQVELIWREFGQVEVFALVFSQLF